VDVITGVIKANFPTRISFQVSSKVDSRTILDQLGAENLLGAGDMLFMPPGTSKITRIHGAYVSEKEIDRIVSFIKKQRQPDYDRSISEFTPDTAGEEKAGEAFDEKYDVAVELVTDLGQASISLVQRYMKIGYNRAARIIERMESEGIVGPSDGVKPRKVLARKLSR
jgi:DNA segregation ATPase FtsK/SpoIIIE, S-DNA-T family